MQSLIALFRIFREYLVLALLCVISIYLISHNDSVPVKVLRSYSIVLFSSLQSSTGWLSSLFSRGTDSEALSDVNVTLMEEVMQLRRLRQENSELRNKIGFRERSKYPLIAAEIVGKNLAYGQHLITLDTGSDDSVAVNMPVINEQGLVGKIIATSSHYSIAQLALHRQFRATAKIKRSRIDGFIAWKEGENLRLKNISRTDDIIVGDTVVTSEYSNIFPPEIMIGVVRTIGAGEEGLFIRVDVTPRVSFSALERVFVLRYKNRPEQSLLEDQSGFREEAR